MALAPSGTGAIGRLRSYGDVMAPLPEPISISPAESTATVYAHGAHVTSWIPMGQPDALWVSRKAVFDSTTAIRGGIPICFPWFGGGPVGVLEPAHGFARTSNWRQVSANAFELTSADIDDGVWPFPFNARYEVTAGTSLRTALTVTNTGNDPFHYEAALHTYLAVGDIHSIRITGLDAASFRDKVTGDDACVQHGDLIVNGETDRIYTSTADVTIDDPVTRRRIRVTKTGSANTVVWNPWIDKSARLADFGDDEWQGMLCIEAANVLDEAVTLDGGGTHTISSELIIEPLA